MSENPIITIAGVVPGGTEMEWDTAYYNPDAHIRHRVARPPSNQGPSISMAGVVAGSPKAPWDTAYPDGESIYVAELRNAERRAALAAGRKALRAKKPRRELATGKPRARRPPAA